MFTKLDTWTRLWVMSFERIRVVFFMIELCVPFVSFVPPHISKHFSQQSSDERWTNNVTRTWFLLYHQSIVLELWASGRRLLFGHHRSLFIIECELCIMTVRNVRLSSGYNVPSRHLIGTEKNEANTVTHLIHVLAELALTRNYSNGFDAYVHTCA